MNCCFSECLCSWVTCARKTRGLTNHGLPYKMWKHPDNATVPLRYISAPLKPQQIRDAKQAWQIIYTTWFGIWSVYSRQNYWKLRFVGYTKRQDAAHKFVSCLLLCTYVYIKFVFKPFTIQTIHKSMSFIFSPWTALVRLA